MASALVDRLRSSTLLRQRVERGIANALAVLAPRRVMRNKRLFDVWERHGYHVTPVHFHEPIPDTGGFRDGTWDWEKTTELVGVELDEAGQLAFLRECTRWRAEYDALRRGPGRDLHEFHFDNMLFGSVDAEVLYCMIRSRRPRRIFEIGSGWSTLLSAQAVRRNAEDGSPCELVAFEPYPNDVLRRGIPGVSRLVPRRLQDLPLETFAELEENDILFIDSSHVVAPAATSASSSSRSCLASRPACSSTCMTCFCPASTRAAG
jgi:hypothetical protein